MTNQLSLVIGATGKTGSRVAMKLEEKGMAVRRGARQSESAFDWEDPSTRVPVLANVSKAYVTYFPDLAVPGAIEKLETFAKVALATGLQYIVLLSGPGGTFRQHGRRGDRQIRYRVYHRAIRVVCAELIRRVSSDISKRTGFCDLLCRTEARSFMWSVS